MDSLKQSNFICSYFYLFLFTMYLLKILPCLNKGVYVCYYVCMYFCMYVSIQRYPTSPDIIQHNLNPIIQHQANIIQHDKHRQNVIVNIQQNPSFIQHHQNIIKHRQYHPNVNLYHTTLLEHHPTLLTSSRCKYVQHHSTSFNIIQHR